jgi:hypothetical protein
MEILGLLQQRQDLQVGLLPSVDSTFRL